MLIEEDGNLRLPDDYTNRVLTDMVKPPESLTVW